jgi:hypothetical protein
VRQRGFIQLSIMGYIVLGLGTVVLILGTLLKIQTARLDSKTREFDTFVAEVKAKGEEQERKTKETIARNQKEKERADAENKRLRTANASLSRSLRESRSSRQYLPAPSPSAKRPDAATFDRAILERAIQLLDERVSGLIEQGDQARIDLDTARTWAQGR